MPSLPASRTTRHLLKIASLGLAGLLAGLLSGCSASHPLSADLPDPDVPNTHVAGIPTYASDANLSQPPQNLDASQAPPLRHPPSTRRLQYGSASGNQPQLIPARHNRS